MSLCVVGLPVLRTQLFWELWQPENTGLHIVDENQWSVRTLDSRDMKSSGILVFETDIDFKFLIFQTSSFKSSQLSCLSQLLL